MEKEKSYYLSLLMRYVDGTISEEEAHQLLDLIAKDPAKVDDILDKDELGNLLLINGLKTHLTESDSSRMRERLKRGISDYNAGQAGQLPVGSEKSETRVRFLGTGWKMIAAAALFCALTIALFLLMPAKQVSEKTLATTHEKFKGSEIPAGTNKAKLTLSDGSVIVLDDVTNGTLTNEGDVKVIKLANGQVAYDPLQGASSKEVLYNTMTTPKGGQYQLRLEDGTKVWLNSESSLSFPTKFSGTTRSVIMTGEVYFEVAKDDAKPFLVKTGNVDVTVLGTHFNINSYDNEEFIKTTLLEGSVKVSMGESVLLRPGQQAKITGVGRSSGSKTSAIKVVDDANTEQVVAWKNGRFDFNGVGLPAVMRQLERWYDIKVKYVGEMPEDVFNGELPRNLALNQVLRILEKMEVNFRVEGRTLVVTK